ncbi:MAG: nitroreductase/quinone reductase family protein [Chloroflexota bacterium]|nr:nitroreductase/quinone reductase family protein [Chloroflexota bacterium]
MNDEIQNLREPAHPMAIISDPAHEQAIRSALARGHTIDITTLGRRSGETRRIEIVFHSFDGRVFISGIPIRGRTRAWLQNLRADPRFTFHLKQLVHADLPATAREITQEPERRQVMTWIARVWRRDVDEMVAHSPLVEVTFEDLPAAAAPASSGQGTAARP